MNEINDLNDLIKALHILKKYIRANQGNTLAKDYLFMVFVDIDRVSEIDKAALYKLGFKEDDYESAYVSSRFGDHPEV